MKLKKQGSFRARKIWIGADNMETAEKEKKFPYLDISTASSNRMITRDPIAGVGDLPDEHIALAESGTPRRETGKQQRIFRDPVSGQGQLGNEANIFYNLKEFAPKIHTGRNPITSEMIGTEVDHLRPNGGKPGKAVIKREQRNPIAGSGYFGREWDPIWKYDGRQRHWGNQTRSTNPITHSIMGEDINNCDEKQVVNSARVFRDPITSEGIPSEEIVDLWHKPEGYALREYLDLVQKKKKLFNTKKENLDERSSSEDESEEKDANPITGNEKNGFDISKEFKQRNPKKNKGVGNPLTGENCQTYNLSANEKEKTPRPSDGHNPLTGENCEVFHLRREEKNCNSNNGEKLNHNVKEQNPLTGDNCVAFSYSVEFKDKMQKDRVCRNAITGDNCETYNLSTDENPRTHKLATVPNSNPLTGENCPSFNFTKQDRQKITKSVSVKSNPLTGQGLLSYDIDPALRRAGVVPEATRNNETNGSSNDPPNGSNGAIVIGGFNPITGQPNA